MAQEINSRLSVDNTLADPLADDVKTENTAGVRSQSATYVRGGLRRNVTFYFYPKLCC